MEPRERYAAHPGSERLLEVLTESARRGFLGPGPVAAHIDHAQGFAAALPMGSLGQRCSLLDLGSGGGLPGLPLFLWHEELEGVLLDGMERRTRFLDEAVRDLGLGHRVEVLTARAEDAIVDSALREAFDVVTARSFGPPSATLELASHFVNFDGYVLISEPPGGRDWDADSVKALGLHQISGAEASIVQFRRVGTPPPIRRWKHIVSMPAVIVQ